MILTTFDCKPTRTWTHVKSARNNHITSHTLAAKITFVYVNRFCVGLITFVWRCTSHVDRPVAENNIGQIDGQISDCGDYRPNR
jgi:hypothetical protein